MFYTTALNMACVSVNYSSCTEIGHDLEITADCSVRGQALIEWSSQSPGPVERIQLEYGCDVDMYNLDVSALL